MYAVVRDTPTSWSSYALLSSELGEAAPRGLLIRVAGRTAEGVRVIELWGSSEELRRHERERLRSAKQILPIGLGAEAVRELAVERVLAPGLSRPCGEPRRHDSKEEPC